MLADEVLLRRFVGPAARRRPRPAVSICSGSRSRKMPDSVMTTSMRGRPSSRAESVARRTAGHSCRTAAGAHQPQRLGDRAAFGLQVVGAPQHHRDRLGQSLPVADVCRSSSRSACFAPSFIANALGMRNGIEAVEVAAGRQHFRGAQQIAARRRPDDSRPSSA